MKHIVIGDIHRRDNWQEINIRKYDKIIFIGDYVDSFELSDHAILENFKKIVSLKKRHPDKVVLLLGNHDVQYLHYPAQRCSGFRESMQRGLTYLFNKDRDLFQMAYQCGNHIFTHAGITASWHDEFLRLPAIEDIKEDSDQLADLINKVESTTARHLLYATSIYRGGYGNGGFLWAEYKETSIDMVPGYHQIVGHTKVDDIHTISYSDRSVTYIDVLHGRTKFFELTSDINVLQ